MTDGPAGASPVTPPFFTVIVPTRNRHDQLRACLASIAELDYPHDAFEVIVVNDGGSPVCQVKESLPQSISIRVLNRSHQGPAMARNAGVEAAAGEFVAFTDDDCTVTPGWLRGYARMFSDHPHAMLGGPIVNALPHNLFASASQILIDYLYEYYNRVPGRATFLTSNNIAVNRAAFQDAGGFDPIFLRAAGEDRDLCARWSHAGRPTWLVPDVRVDHAHVMRLTGFVRQHFGYGRGAHYFRIREAERGRARLRVEPLRFYTHMLRAPWSRTTGPLIASATSALLMISQVANAMGYFWERLVAAGRTRSRPD